VRELVCAGCAHLFAASAFTLNFARVYRVVCASCEPSYCRDHGHALNAAAFKFDYMTLINTDGCKYRRRVGQQFWRPSKLNLLRCKRSPTTGRRLCFNTCCFEHAFMPYHFHRAWPSARAAERQNHCCCCYCCACAIVTVHYAPFLRQLPPSQPQHDRAVPWTI
jgi:hypothetical protein